MKVVVLGAGVIGVTSAYFLALAGHQVTVLEKNSEAAMGCSYANGGQLSYSHIDTWANKASISAMLKAAIMPNSFLSISDLANKDFLKWIYEFYKNSSAQKSQENSKKIFTLSAYSKEILEQILLIEKDIKFDYKKEGILHFYRNKKKFEHAVKEAELYDKIGCRAQILSAEECVKKEPTLVKLFDEENLAGGIFYEDDASGNSFLFTKALEKICREKYGVIFEYETDVKNILTNHKKITGINSNKGVFVANKYVYALGAQGNRLLRGIGVESKIYPIKGYSLSISSDEEFIAPSLALTDSENKIVYSRIGNIFRVAGTIEICGFKASQNKNNIEFLKKNLRLSFSDFGNLNFAKQWSGFRPFRPNSLPLICVVERYGNLLLNTGHGSLGWTMASASGKILADLVIDKKDERFSFLSCC
jgi:D-amino-acid dehydrogenase